MSKKAKILDEEGQRKKKERKKAYAKVYWAANREKLLARNKITAKKWREETKEIRKEKWREHYKKNKEKIKIYQKQHRESLKGTENYRKMTRNWYLKYNFGITNDDYNVLLESQNKGCAICSRSDQVLHVDHNHETNAIRGLLCNNCNASVGFLKEDVKLFQNAIAYLKKYQSGVECLN